MKQDELQSTGASSSPDIVILEDDVTANRTKIVPNSIEGLNTSRSIPELDLSLDFVHAIHTASPKKGLGALNETEKSSNYISTSFNSTAFGTQINQSVLNSDAPLIQSKETQFQDLIYFEPSAASIIPNYHESTAHHMSLADTSRGNLTAAPADSSAKKCANVQYQTKQPIQLTTNVSISNPQPECKYVEVCQNDFPFQFVSEVTKDANGLCRGEPIKMPIYYINYGETQTDLLPQHAVQGTQTTSEILLAVKNGKESVVKAKDRCFPRSKRKSTAISASIQTECSINSKGQRNKSIKERTTSAVQTIKLVPQKTFATIGTQTDIARKRAVNKKRKYQEVEVQTANPAVSHHNVYLQTSFSPQTSQSFDSPESWDGNCGLDTPKNSCLDLVENLTIQTETQTMPFNLDDFFDANKTSCNTSASMNLPTFSDFGSFIDLDTPVYNADVPAETQTNWDELLAEVDSPFNPLWERDLIWRENLNEPTQTSLFETDSSSYNFSVLDC